MTTYFQHVKNGVRFAHVYHISGLDWAATDDPDFATWYNAQGIGGSAYTSLMFGAGAALIQMLPVLSHNLGAQTITSSREGGIDVGQWGVTVNGDASGYEFGKLFSYVPYTGWQQGLIGLNWSPDTTQPSVVFGIMSRDLRLARDDAGVATTGLAPNASGSALYWRKDQDFGLSDFIIANAGCYLWLGSSCISAESVPALSAGEWSMDIKSGHFGTPLEDLFFNNVARYQITNIPLETAGRTARLFAVPIDVTETVAP